jgi:hypothetical protein
MDTMEIFGELLNSGNAYRPKHYLCKFDDAGHRTETHPVALNMTDEEKQRMLGNGFIEITNEEWEQYCAGKIRGADGTPIDAPPYEPSKDERLEQLDSQYNADKAELIKYFTEALLAEDEEVQVELKAEMAEVDVAYIEARRQIERG